MLVRGMVMVLVNVVWVGGGGAVSTRESIGSEDGGTAEYTG